MSKIEIVKKGHTIEDVIDYFSDDKSETLDKKDNSKRSQRLLFSSESDYLRISLILADLPDNLRM